MIAFRPATRDDVAAVVALLADDALGRGREQADLSPYLAAFDAMGDDPMNRVIVGEAGGEIVACYQLTVIRGLSLSAATRAQIEGVRIAAHLRGQGQGAALVADAEARACAAGAVLMQLTSNATRGEARRFYEAQGYDPSHVGFKKRLD